MYCSRHEECSCEQNRKFLNSWSSLSSRGDRQCRKEVRKMEHGKVEVLRRKMKQRKGAGSGGGWVAISNKVIREGHRRN